MRCLSQIRAAVFLVVLSDVTFGQAKPKEAIKTVRISGRLVTRDGVPVSFPVRISKLDRDVPLSENTAMADGHGVFTFLAESNHKYRIWLGARMKTAPRTVDTASGKDIDVGDLVFEYCPAVNGSPPKRPVSQAPLIGNLKLEQIVVDPQTLAYDPYAGIRAPLPVSPNPVSNGMEEGPQCWTGPSLERRAEWEAFPMVSFDHYLSVESFVGGKVKSIRVVRYNPKLNPIQIKEEVRKVWLGVFWFAAASIIWQEGNAWNIEAMVEYEDGKQSTILMDGWVHVQVQDRQGKYWFIRESPAVQ